MSWVPRDDYSPETGIFISDFFPNGDHVEPMDSRRIAPEIQETMPRQRSSEPNFSGSQASSPFMDAVSDLPVRNHMPSLNEPNALLNPYGHFYQGLHDLANTLPTTTMAGQSTHMWNYFHTSGNGSECPYPGSPSVSQEYPEVNQVENSWTRMARWDYGNAPSSHLGYDTLAQNPWNGIVPGSAQDLDMPGGIIHETRKYPLLDTVQDIILVSPCDARKAGTTG